MNPVPSASRTTTLTFDPTSPTYHDELFAAKFISAAQLAAAKSGTAKDISKANDEAFKTAKKNSLDDIKNSLKRDASSTTANNQALIEYENPLTSQQSEVISPEYKTEQRRRDAEFVRKYTAEGYKFVKSSNKDHNCLIVSILQHLTKDYREEGIKQHLKDAAPYRLKMNDELKKDLSKEQIAKFDRYTMLEADNLTFLLSEMKKEERFKHKDLTVEIWSAGENGEKHSFEVVEGTEKVIIFQKTDHFVAVIPPRKLGSSTDTASTKPATATMTTPAQVASTGSTTGTVAIIPAATLAQTDRSEG